ncbi:MAG: hypothetical protein ACI8QC_003162 [Planctomycetota bacterium]|jgi:hypothetical protein
MTDTQATEASEKAGTNPRETEQTPVMLRKASQLLLIGALFPFYTGVKYATTAVMEAGDKTMAFNWTTLILAKALVVIGGWVAYECAVARGQGKKKSPLDALAKTHEMAGALVALVFFAGAFALVFTAGNTMVLDVNGDITGVFTMGAAAEIGVLALGIFTLAHIVGYINGGKFNPIFPLMFMGPALAGLLNLVASINVFGSQHMGLGVLGLIGSVIVGGAGCFAMYVMGNSIKEAKEHGKRRQDQMRADRKAEREASRAKRDADK